VVVKGDMFVVRSPDTTLGGGEIVEPHARRHKRFQPSVITLLETLERGSPEELVLAALGTGATETKAAAQKAGLPLDQVKATLEALLADGRVAQLGDHWLTAAGWRGVRDRAVQALDGYHNQYPFRQGMPREELKSRLGLPTRPFMEAIQTLTGGAVIEESDSTVRLAGHRVSFTPEQQAKIVRLKQALGASPFAPPSRTELEKQLGLDPEAVTALLQQGDLVRVGDDIVLLTSAYDEIERRTKEYIAAHGKITVAELRDLFGTSRKYALAIAAYLDDQHITRRVGDERVPY
jgi:selenocysteine-specific elongation factor